MYYFSVHRFPSIKSTAINTSQLLHPLYLWQAQSACVKKILFMRLFLFKCYFKSDINVFHAKHQMKRGGLPHVVIIYVQGI